MLPSDVENPPPKSYPNSLAVVVPSLSPGDGSDLCRSEHSEGAAAAPAPASDPPPPPRTTITNNFSIREYVFRSRSKDIYTNWPFSQKNLQFCLQHGVTELLPPFRHLDVARCGSFEIPKFENRSVFGKDCVANFKSEPSSSKPKVPSLRVWDHATELDVDGAASNEQLSSVQSATKDDVPLVAIRVSRVTTEQVPAKEVIPPTSLKSGSLPQTAGKKCRFIVKFGTKSERSLGDVTASNCTSVSENMASKICPVCKIFSSSSNTTLNAHIDQCLSLESAPQRLLIRQRIKPRKTRLMVDIYETALRCTIEELNQRNGLNWANSSSSPAPNADVASKEERKPSMPLVHAGNPSDTGAVYIDANGTKLRILSKFNVDPPELRRAKDDQSKKSSLGKKGNGIFQKKSKKLHGQKHHKYLKLASKGKKVHSQKARQSQLFSKQKNLHGMQEGSEGSQGRLQMSLGPLKPGLSGTLKLWSSSKRTAPKKKIVAKEGENPQRCQLHLASSLLIEDDQKQTSLVGRTPMRHHTPNLLDTSENSDYSWSSDSEKERSWSDFRARKTEELVICDRSLSWSDVTPDSVEKWGYPLTKRKLPKEDRYQGVDISNIRKNAEHGELQHRHRKGIEIHVVEGGCARTLGNINKRQRRPRSSATKALRFSTLRKGSLSLFQSSENSSDRSAGHVEFSFKKSKLHLTEDPDQDQSVEEGTNFEFCSSESSEREMIGLRKDTETSDLHGEVQYTKSTLNDMRDAEPSVDALEDCTWGLSKYYELPHLNLRAHDACDAVNEGNADGGKGDEGYGAGQSSSFIEIDPIPIPGPPGSFLPSPGAMGSDDFQGNSSLTTSLAQSSHDQEDVVDGDVSDSPISTTSTVSNLAEANLGMYYSEELVSRGHPVVPEDTWAAFSSDGNNASPIQHTPSPAAPLSCSTLVETIDRANNVSIKKGPPFTGNGDEPCCCQKERAVSQSSILDYREMEPPSPRRVPLVAVPGAARQTDQMPSGCSRLDEGYEALIPKAAKSSNISSSSRSFGEFPNGSVHADYDFLSPSGSSNLVLRLMGKDLIVVNKEEDASIPDQSKSSARAPFKIQDSQPVTVCDHCESRQNQDYLYKDMDYSPVQSFFTGSSSGYSGIITMPMTVRAPKPVPVSTLINPNIASDFTASMMGPEYDGGLSSSVQVDMVKVKPVGPSKQMMPKVAPMMNPGKAMLVTDDASWKESGFKSWAVNNMNLPQDVVLLPNASRGSSTLPPVYQTREPVVELAGSYPRGAVFIDGQTRGPFVVTQPAFLGFQGSGYVYYPSHS